MSNMLKVSPSELRGRLRGLNLGFLDLSGEKALTQQDFETTYSSFLRAVDILVRMETLVAKYHEVRLAEDIEASVMAVENFENLDEEISRSVFEGAIFGILPRR